MTVRIATRADEERIMALCRDLHTENALLPMSEDRVRETIERAFSRDGGIIGVIGRPGEPLRGIIYVIIGRLWYSDDWVLEELFSYVPPEHRRSTYAQDLIDFAKRQADELRLKLMIGIISNERTEAKVRLYTRKLGPPAGAYFVYGGRTGEPYVRQ